MKFKTLKCRTCHELARGSVEILCGVAEFTEPDNTGSVQYAGETDIWWDEQRTKTAPSGRWQLVCPNGHTWYSTMTEVQSA